MADIFNTLKEKYRNGNMLVKILFINIAVFVIIRLAAVVSVILGLPGQSIVEWFAMPTNPDALMHKPWTVLTYMFSHYDVLHILFNMLWLYWLGRIFMEFFTEKHFTALYIYGGLGGALLYLLIFNTVPAYDAVGNTYLLGASASVYAIVIAATMKSPDYPINLMFGLQVSLKWITVIIIGFDLLTITDGVNLGGHIAHIGGILVGFLFARAFKKGIDITRPLNTLIDHIVNLFSKKQDFGFKRNVKYKRAKSRTDNGTKPTSPKASKTELSEMDAILEKIKQSGYTALTDEEKEKLFNISKKA